MFGGCILTKDFSFLRGAMVVCAVLCILISASGQTMKPPLVRIAELEVDPAQLTAYRTALQEEIATSIRVEPGVLTLYAVSVKDHPAQIRLFEIYANVAAYEAHLQSRHFKKYKSHTARM